MQSRARRPAGPGTTKVVQRTGDPPKPAPGSLTDPLDAAVAADGRGQRKGPQLEISKHQSESRPKIPRRRLFQWVEIAKWSIPGYHGSHRVHSGSSTAIWGRRSPGSAVVASANSTGPVKQGASVHPLSWGSFASPRVLGSEQTRDKPRKGQIL